MSKKEIQHALDMLTMAYLKSTNPNMKRRDVVLLLREACTTFIRETVEFEFDEEVKDNEKRKARFRATNYHTDVFMWATSKELTPRSKR
jgi:hypothetical protein